MKFAILFRTGKAWTEGKPYWEQDLIPNRNYFVEILGDSLIAGGPFANHTGALVIAEADDLAEIEDIVKNAPAVLAEKFEYTIYPWHPNEGILKI